MYWHISAESYFEHTEHFELLVRNITFENKLYFPSYPLDLEFSFNLHSGISDTHPFTAKDLWYTIIR